MNRSIKGHLLQIWGCNYLVDLLVSVAIFHVVFRPVIVYLCIQMWVYRLPVFLLVLTGQWGTQCGQNSEEVSFIVCLFKLVFGLFGCNISRGFLSSHCLLMQSNVSLQIDHVVKMQGEVFQRQDDKLSWQSLLLPFKQTNRTKESNWPHLEVREAARWAQPSCLPPQPVAHRAPLSAAVGRVW